MKTKLLVFGITGDLSQTKLLPAILDIIKNEEFSNIEVIGASRREVSSEDALGRNTGLLDRTRMVKVDLADIDDYRELKKNLDLQDDEQLVVYLSVPPSSATQIVDFMGRAGINSDNVKVLFEKPFGLDLASAKQMIKNTAKHFEEAQIYRIDHFMTKQVASEIIRLRIDANNHHHKWGKHSVESIEVIASEIVGVGHRASFYEQTGAMRDIVQGHLMQLLALVLMGIPPDFNMQNIPRYRQAALEQLKPADPRYALEAQYEGYDKEVGNIGSQVETFVRITLNSHDKRWKGVPITLATGKKLATKKTQIIIHYRDGSQDMFDETELSAKARSNEPYEKVLMDAIYSRKSLFTSSPEVIRSWEILQPLQQHWEMDRTVKTYKPGSKLEDVT